MRVSLFVTLLVTLLSLASAQTTYTVCQNYSGQANSNSSTQVALLTAIVTRAAGGGIFSAPSGTTYLIPGLFNSSGPLYNIFTGTTKYRSDAPNYVTNQAALGTLAGKLVAYFGQLFGCTAANYPTVSNYDMYAVHQNMGINQNMETYFNTQLALTLLSFGVDGSVVNNVAAPALGYFNRCGAPTSTIGLGNNPNTSRAQICGTSDCSLATGATQATCNTYYPSGNGASGMYAASGLLVAMAAIVASLLL